MSRAGQANEVGSVFRCTVATYLAVHGLRSNQIPGLDLPVGVDPVRLEFETSDPTDDIRVMFSDRRRAYVSVKRRVTRGRPLDETVRGWVAQAPTLGSDDLLVLAGEEFAGPTKIYDRVFSRYRTGLPMETKQEQVAFKSITDLLPEEFRDVVLKQVRILHMPGSTDSGASRALLVALMDLAVAELQGQQAVSTLADLFHSQAGRALGSGIEDWVVALSDAGLTVIEDRGGPAGMRAAARLAAVSTYRERLMAETGRIDLSLLAEDLPPIVVNGLIDNLEIDMEGSRTPDRLLRHLRRWRRMLVVGQPGSGKSVALREIATHCVTHPDAPVPIRVVLPRLMKEEPERLTIDGIIDAATADVVSEDQRLSLAEYLAEELAQGRAIVLCDGFDECGQRASWVAQQLVDILDKLHPRAGFVLATRANAEASAARLELARVELASPSDLSETVDSVLVACAQARVPEDQRGEWLATRRTWIKEANEQHSHLLAVPLLAILLALICANASDADLPKGRAALLHRAVEQSVQRWEQARETLDSTRPWSSALTTAMLLQGFIVLGRILDGGAAPSRNEALDALGEMLRDPLQWAMPPAQANEVAEQVLRFWDEHVAVFVVNAADELTTRSKVFAEIAIAMWAARCEQTELRDWLAQAIAHTDSDGAIGLAAGLDPRVIGVLLDVGANSRPEATLLVADLAIRGIAEFTHGELERTIEQLTAGISTSCDAARRTLRNPKDAQVRLSILRASTRDPDRWAFVQSACQLVLPIELRSQRADLIASADLDDRSATIAAALCELTDASTDVRPLTETGVAAVLTALAIPLPAKEEVVQKSRRVFSLDGGGPLAPGLSQVALAAVHRLNELADDSGTRLFEIAMHTDYRSSDPIFAALDRAGIDTSHRWEGFMTGINRWVSDHKEYHAAFLSDLNSLSDPDFCSKDDDLWSLTDVGDLLAAIGYLNVGIGNFARAFVHDRAELRRAWLDAVADAYDINKSAVARQARLLRGMNEELDVAAADVSDDWSVASAKPVVKPTLREDLGDALTTYQVETLVACLEADSDWIAWAAAKVLMSMSPIQIYSRKLSNKDMSTWPRSRASLLYAVAIILSYDNQMELLTEAANSELADYRSAARLTISVAPALDADGSIMEALRRDPDLSVRPKGAEKELPSPAYWTCDGCKSVNDLSTEDCASCEDGVQPGA